jgi:hypothetical protein
LLCITSLNDFIGTDGRNFPSMWTNSIGMGGRINRNTQGARTKIISQHPMWFRMLT